MRDYVKLLCEICGEDLDDCHFTGCEGLYVISRISQKESEQIPINTKICFQSDLYTVLVELLG